MTRDLDPDGDQHTPARGGPPSGRGLPLRVPGGDEVRLLAPAPETTTTGAPTEPDVAPEVDADDAPYFTAEVLEGLRRIPFERWSAMAIILDLDRESPPRLTTRGDAIGFLRSADLLDLAHEAARRKVPRGGLMVIAIASARTTIRILFSPRRRRKD